MEHPQLPPAPSMDGSISYAASEVTKAGALTTVIAGLTSNTVIAILGLLLAILGFMVNLHFQHRRDKREEKLHLLQLEIFRKKTDSAPDDTEKKTGTG